MYKWKWIRIISISIVMVSLIILIWLSHLELLHLLVVSVLIIGILVWNWAETVIKAMNKTKDRSVDDNQMISILNHYRHDALNNLQVLFSYTKLKKYDKLELFMDKLKGELEQESLIARLEIPSLVLYLMSLRAQCHTLELELSIDQGVQLSKNNFDQDRICSIILKTIEIFKGTAQVSHDIINQLDLHISQDSNLTCFTFNYDGKLSVEACEFAFKEKQLKFNKDKHIHLKSEIKELKALVEISVLHHS